MKPIDAFGKDKSRRFGKTLYCKPCTAAINKVIRKRNNAQRTEYNRKYRNENREQYNRWERDYYVKNQEVLQVNQKKWRETLKGHVKTMHLAARLRARKKGVVYELTPASIETLILAQNNECSLTGIEFDYRHESESSCPKRPWVPSLDRMDNERGYSFDNIRIVCHAVNQARNVLPIELFDLMCRARVEILDRA